MYISQGDLLQSVLTLDEAQHKFPRSGEILNAVGLSFLKLKNVDSALYFFLQAKKISATANIAETNLLGAIAWFNVGHAVDSVISPTTSSGIETNELAIANLKGQKITIDGKFSNDTSLNIYQAMTLCNYLINQKENVDTALIRSAIKLSRKEVNDPFSGQLLISAAHALYAHGLIKEAMQLVREAAFNSGDENYLSLLGLWLLDQNNPVLAAVYFEAAAEKSHPLALYYLAIAEAESESLDQAIIHWDSLRKSGNKNVVAFAEKMEKVLKTKSDQMANLSDDEKYYFCRYKIPLTDKGMFDKTASTIADEKLRAQAIIDRSKKWFVMDEPKEAEELLNRLTTAYTNNINQQIANLKLMLAVERSDWRFVQENISKVEISLSQKIYFEGLLAIQNGNQRMAEQKFSYLEKADNQFEEGVVAAARRLKHFSALVDGLLAKPNSVKILKQHCLMAADLGFIDASQDSLNKLREILPDALFKKFVEKNPNYFRKN